LKKTLGTGSIDRSARVARIKRVIIGLIVMAILLPSILCIILFAKMNKLEKQIIELSYERERVNVITESTLVHEPNKGEPVRANGESEILNIEKIENPESNKSDSDEVEVDESEAGEVEANKSEADKSEADKSEANKSENAKSEADEVAAGEDTDDNLLDDEKTDDASNIQLKKVYLTFDDGPSSNTSRILDILNEYDVKGTFFVVGRLSDTTTPMYKRIVEEGHAIGMHSYTHKYGEIYASVDAFVYDLEKIQSLIYEQTGVLTKLYRFPGGSSNTVSHTNMSELIKELDKRDIKYFDWNVVSGDASSRNGISKEAIVRNCTVNALSQESAVILMHDLPEKATTVEALPEIIEYFKSIGVEILPIDDNLEEVHHTIDITE